MLTFLSKMKSQVFKDHVFFLAISPFNAPACSWATSQPMVDFETEAPL